jgi:SAM-dependent methyltransferase
MLYSLAGERIKKETTMGTDHPDQPTIQEINRAGWNKAAPHFYGVTALPIYGPLAPTENDLRLLDQIRGARLLEIGCGSGHSLLYLGEHGAAELWGLDLSETQIGFASTLLQEKGYAAHLFTSPMEENPGIPDRYFDMVLSIYALGWTYNIARTLSLITSYLKPGGSFIFSWEHPLYGCLKNRDGQMVLKHSYSDEMPFTRSSWVGGATVMQYPRQVSTYLNSLIEAGLILEKVVEGGVNPLLASEEDHLPDRWYSLARAQMMPTTLIVKARKPGVVQQ